MSDLRKKLDALRKAQGLVTAAEIAQRREARPSPAQPPVHEDAGNGAGEGSLRDRLRRLNVAVPRGGETDQRADAAPVPASASASPCDVAALFPGEAVGDGDAACYRVRTEYPLEHRQGQTALGDILAVSAKHIAFSSGDAALAGFDPRKAAFIDTETTGLAGGTGTVPFLVGAGYFAGDVFRLDQYFLRDYDEEAPMLADLAENLGHAATLVSYNGKSFDLPLLRTRFVQHRVRFPWGGAAHLDLVHASRRFWKRRLSDCSLGNIEREILAIRREGDVPSHLIPQMWFEYLRTRDARPLEGVFYHHRMDILSLVALTAWLARCLEAPDGCGFDHAEDRLSVVRLHFRQKNYDEVIRLGGAFQREEGDAALRRECLELLARACKRRARWEEMEEAWEALLALAPGHPAACVELAKHHEHRTRDLERAEALCAAALNRIDDRIGRGRAPGLTFAEIEAVRERIERIRRKIAKARPHGDDFDFG